MTSNRMAAAAALRKNIMLKSTGDAGISLRSTRTSEVSSFVKNCNMAENYALKRELNIWHKDTNFAVRKVTKKQDDMYRALLKLSRTKKLIKIVKQDQLRDREELRRWIHSKRRNRRNVIQPADDTMSLLDSGVHEDQNQPSPSITSPNILKINRSPIPSQESTPHNKLTSTHTRNLTVDNISQHNQNSTRNQQQKAGEQWQRSKPEPTIFTSQAPVDKSETAIDAVGKANYEENGLQSSKNGTLTGLTLGNVHLQANAGQNGTETPTNLTHFTSMRPLHAQRLKDTKFLEIEKAKALTEEDDADLETSRSSFHLLAGPEDEHLNFDLISEEAFPAGEIDNAVFVEPKEEADTENQPPKSKVQRKKNRPKRQRIKLKSNKPDPTEELIKNSTIAVRPGKSYDVTVYKKGESGNFEGDMTSWNTTVDVAKYFNLSSRRERLQRERLLQDAREKEAQQRHRVDRFLEKLSRELETDERAKNYNRDREEARLMMQRRLEALKRGPPKYGVGDVTSVPNYVRICPRLTTEERKLPRKVRKRSSWSVPSLFTLQIAAANPRLGPPLPGGLRNPPSVSEASSHLVNINLDKYLFDVANS